LVFLVLGVTVYLATKDWLFLSTDTFGGLFSLFALGMQPSLHSNIQSLKLANEKIAAQGSFDILAGVLYILVSVVRFHCKVVTRG
jgi:hypothetical protein